MAMRLFTPAEFEEQLRRRGCSKLEDQSDQYGTYWTWSDSQVFQVPHPEEVWKDELRYPDWILDDLITTHGLPTAPDED